MSNLGTEFAAEEWSAHLELVPHAAVVCGGKLTQKLCKGYGDDGQGLGFVCRGKKHSCGRFVCACEGGDDDRRSACFAKHERAQKRLPRDQREAAFQ